MSIEAENPANAPSQPDAEAPKKRRRPGGNFECRLGMVLGLGGLIGSRLGQLWVAFDVFSQFTLQFALVTLAFFIGAVLPRAKLLSAFLVIIFGLVGIGAWPHVASRSPVVVGNVAAGERALKVASFNTLWVNDDDADIGA